MPNSDPYRELFERSADCVLLLNGEMFIDCNAAAVELFAASGKSDIFSVRPSDLSPPFQPDGRDSLEKAEAMIAIALEHGSHRFEWDHQRLNGEVFQAEVLLTVINLKQGPVIHSIVRDVSERKRLEDELRHAQKMEAVGKLAGGIAHDFNNLLVVMLGSCDLLERENLSPVAMRYVRQIQDAGESAAGLIRQLLTFSRKQEVREQHIELSVVVNQLMSMLERLVSEHIELRVTTSDPSLIFANLQRAEQVVLNLVSNAQDAMPDGGRLTVEVAPGRSEKLGDCVVLEISDTGIGMDEETRDRAFEPFFTTKEIGGGTGLGLATVYTIVQQSGGEITIDSTVGVGTRIAVRFPLVDAPTLEPETPEPTETPIGDATILLVEDDSAIRHMVEILLSTSGYKVLTASDGDEGLRIATVHRGKFDLIMTDVVMPRIGGPEMILRLRELGIDTPVIYMSGYTDDTMQKVDALDEDVDLIEKPFNLRTLVDRVHAALVRARE